MIKPKDYDNVEAATFGEASGAQLTPGGHGVEIKKAEIEKTDWGDRMNIYFDIHEGGEFDGYYAKKYETQKKFNSDAKWRGVFRQPIYTKDNTTSPYFKGLIKAVEESNKSYRWNWDEATLKGKALGLVFREKEFKANDGSILTTVEPAWACDFYSADAMPVPKKKCLTPEQKGFIPAPEEKTPFDNNDKLPF